MLLDPPRLALSLPDWKGTEPLAGLPDSGQIRLWLAPIDLPQETLSRLHEHLSATERDRMLSFKRTTDQRRQLVARGLVREALGALMGIAPAGLRFENDSRGKPMLMEPGVSPPWHFNLSHSGDWVILAVAAEAPVGLDLEIPDPGHSIEAIARRWFGPRERATVLAASSEHRLMEFYRIWTVREAYLKATGSGLSGSGGKDLLRSDGTLIDRHWQVWRLDQPPGYQAALVARAGSWQVSGWRL